MIYSQKSVKVSLSICSFSRIVLSNKPLFVNELFKYQFQINHHCKIIIEGLDVTVETYTHDVNGITMQDKKIKKFADELFDDLRYFDNET